MNCDDESPAAPAAHGLVNQHLADDGTWKADWRFVRTTLGDQATLGMPHL